MTTETAKLRGPLRKRESHLWARHPQDWYVEPEWCSQRLFEAEPFAGSVLDPACGLGRIVESAARAGLLAFGTDLVRRSEHALFEMDFTLPDFPAKADNIVSNPPFGRALDFVQLALDRAPKVAMLLPSNWVQGDERSRWLEASPLKRVLFLTPRPSMPPGEAILAGIAPGNGTTDYAWFIWERGHPHAWTGGWLRRDRQLPLVEHRLPAAVMTR